jgi:uncharacterized protein YbbC (DUF1343 family)
MLASFKITKYLSFLLILLALQACAQPALIPEPAGFRLGAERFDLYLPMLKGKKVALVLNHTSVLGKTHLADTLLAQGVQVVKIFAPEHGFRGTAADGEHINNDTDTKTGIKLVSLYGKTRKPTADMLADVDLVLFDIQDVGVRFYTYPTTMHFVMDACAENNKPMIVLDRPNPYGRFIDGPILQKKYQSMVGWNPLPVLHGLTMGELALMINSEGWLESGKKAELYVIENKEYSHRMRYILPVGPSPNLPNQQAINLYASLCLFEAFDASVGRGTSTQFQVIGAPNKVFGKYTFSPEPRPGATSPPLKGKLCYGVDLRQLPAENLGFSLKYVLDFYKKAPDRKAFLNNIPHFDRLAGSDSLRKQVLAGWSEKKIRASWQKDLAIYKKLREKYRIYPD